MLAEFEPLLAAAFKAAMLEPALLTETLVLAELLFRASPLRAEPPVVFPLTLAEPEDAPWLLLFATFALLLLFRATRVDPLNRIWLFEYGPVVPIVPVAAEANPALRLTPSTDTATIRSNFFI